MGLLLGLDRGHLGVRNVEEQRTSYDKGSGNADRHCAGASPSDVPPRAHGCAVWNGRARGCDRVLNRPVAALVGEAGLAGIRP